MKITDNIINQAILDFTKAVAETQKPILDIANRLNVVTEPIRRFEKTFRLHSERL
jgi:hypothetical protein